MRDPDRAAVLLITPTPRHPLGGPRSIGAYLTDELAPLVRAWEDAAVAGAAVPAEVLGDLATLAEALRSALRTGAPPPAFETQVGEAADVLAGVVRAMAAKVDHRPEGGLGLASEGAGGGADQEAGQSR
jgi:hypothetical protein